MSICCTCTAFKTSKCLGLETLENCVRFWPSQSYFARSRFLLSPPPPLFFCPRTAKTRSGDEIRPSILRDADGDDLGDDDGGGGGDDESDGDDGNGDENDASDGNDNGEDNDSDGDENGSDGDDNGNGDDTGGNGDNIDGDDGGNDNDGGDDDNDRNGNGDVIT